MNFSDEHCCHKKKHRLYYAAGKLCPCVEPCKDCGAMKDLEYGPDPYEEGINKDITQVWQCKRCRTISRGFLNPPGSDTPLD